jgi:hypothetical protein
VAVIDVRIVESDDALRKLLTEFEERVAGADADRIRLSDELAQLEKKRVDAQKKRDALAVEFGRVTSAAAVITPLYCAPSLIDSFALVGCVGSRQIDRTARRRDRHVGQQVQVA